MRTTRGARRGEEGATLIVASILLTAVAAFAGLLLAGGAVYAAAQEGRRAADLAALAGAANLPTLNLGTTENPLGLPRPTQRDTPLGTVDTTTPLPTLGEDFLGGTCAVVARQFGDKRSPVTDSYATAATTCTPTVRLPHPWVQRLVDCLAGAVASATCAADLAERLADELPLPAAGDRVVDAVGRAVERAGLRGQVVTTTLVDRIRALDAALGGRLQPLLALLNETGGISVDAARLAPAILSPEVAVTVTQQVDVPGAALVGAGPVTVSQTSTARRTFKNAVVVPTVSLPRRDGLFEFDANDEVAAARELAFDALRAVADEVTPAAGRALAGVAGPGPTVSATFDDVLADLRDVIDPPNGTAPDTRTLVDEAIAQRRPVLVAAAGYALDPSQVLGTTVYGLPGVAQLLPGLLFVPAFDMVPAVLSAGPLGQVVATPVDTAVAAAHTKGLYRARLVD